MTAPTPLFIVGTGRCGSTMLSTMVNDHPDLLSLSEFFTCVTDLGGRIAQTFPREAITGKAFWPLIAGIHPRLAAMTRHDVMMDEVLYRPGNAARFTQASGYPAILNTTLPHLTDAPEALLAELEAFVRGLPEAPVGQLYQQLFGWLTQRLSRRQWVERSGGSLRVVKRLRAHFPDARFVHLVRDGRNCAISMSRHLGFRMALVSMQQTEILGVDPWECDDRSNEGDLPDELVPLLPERFERQAFLDYETAVPLCGHYWSGELLAGIAELEGLGPNQLLTLRYEDFLRAPRAAIAQLFEFIGVPADGAWLDRMAGNMHAAQSSWTKLAPDSLRELDLACRPGFAALGHLYPS